MSKWDQIYCDLAKTILEEGVYTPTRTGTGAYKIPGWHFRLDPDEFPILTTKQVFIRQAVLEMLWIYQAQSNEVSWLKERNVHIWDKWEIDSDGNWRSEIDGHVLKTFDPALAGTIGTAYGYIVKKYHLIDTLIDSLKHHPEDRRRVLSLWQDGELESAVLPSCVWSSEWDITDGKLNLFVHQRSCDVPLGLPFNVTQYAVLQRLIAQVCDLEVGILDWSIKDAHIYENQVEGMLEQLYRYESYGDFPAPTLWINPEIKDFYAFDNSKDLKDIKLEGYRHMGPIKFPLSQ